jgi:hypothetical protein
MTVIIHKESHVHAMSINLEEVLKQFEDKKGFFIETIILDEVVGLNALYGPIMGDEPVLNGYDARREDRDYTSRMVNAPMRPTNILTIIAGPHDGHECVLYTAYPGPVSPKGLNDPSLKPEEVAEATAFWAVHALADGK